jgi:hypothetical protein
MYNSLMPELKPTITRLKVTMKTNQIALILFALSIAACAPGAEFTPVATEAAQPVETIAATATLLQADPTSTIEEDPVSEEIEVPIGAEALVQIAVDDLAGRLGIPAAEIELVQYEEVVWPDASLGCPHPEMKYIQVPQDGVFIQLSAGGETHDYHGGGGRDPFLCEQQPPSKETAPKLDLTPPSMDD